MTRRSQRGYTLVELILTVAIGALLMGALVSVFLTTTRASNIATGRVEASGQLRNFEFFAYADFAGATIADLNSGCTASAPCSSAAITLTGVPVSNPVGTRHVTYTWNQTNQFLDRQIDANPPLHAATNVTNFHWYVDANQTVVVTMTITVNTYTQAQMFRFYPRRNL